ncbi:hypothetical protein HYFRA_00013563 [Hymenoscyphus fraxineus]|uniref:Pantothenate transporter liz1 n=1 Tax=Hymenoscyphus fraxineus TaxID=746836 RepID=A0A9N9L8Z5_9HELO|nr:hypothetical protein HYFRA_00013563 [Hymenoscyphus fraxineus]
MIGGLTKICVGVSLAIWEIPEGWRWFNYYIASASSGLSGLCMAWAHEICTADSEERAIVIGSMNEMAYVVQVWLPLLVWEQVEAPYYRKGFITIAVLSFAMMVTALVIKWFFARDSRINTIDGASEPVLEIEERTFDLGDESSEVKKVVGEQALVEK